MKLFNIFILLLAFVSPVIADTGFEELFHLNADNASTTADRVTNFHADNINISIAEKITELNALSQNIDSFINASPDNAVLWFIKGLNYSNLAAIYNVQRDDQKVSLFINKKNTAYEKAMQLDQTANTLTAAIYAVMKHGLPEALKITAIQKELSLGGNGENESYYWYLHWSNVSALQQAGRIDEAKQALENMKSEMLEQGISNPDYDKLTQQVEQDINHPPQTQTEKQDTATRKKESTTNNRNHSVVALEDLTWLLIVVIIIALILAWKYEMLIFKKKH
ncbi:MAG: hypothetical protein OQK76_07010 [Gammaproteobacteria bacterium]|nr:hypothetical protein [Gammaproteobacteria bacterium]MCW9005322.1 hypothetical protein [Gammaproteobacteria bacterium]MCW9057003.1 hypothetical protein [Gammaproteobacteria bacterium]